jgi:hypothetical protein
MAILEIQRRALRVYGRLPQWSERKWLQKGRLVADKANKTGIPASRVAEILNIG